jgi:hypothetical protein
MPKLPLILLLKKKCRSNGIYFKRYPNGDKKVRVTKYFKGAKL